MAALLQAKLVTAIDPKRQLIRYLRRSTSICGQRTPENFTIHVPMQLKRFFETVLASTRDDENQIEKLRMAAKFTLYKIDQYTNTLRNLAESHTRADIQEPVNEAAESIQKFVTESVAQVEAERAMFSPKFSGHLYQPA